MLNHFSSTSLIHGSPKRTQLDRTRQRQAASRVPRFESLEQRNMFAAAPFTLVAIPDTQFYSEDNPHIFHSQTQWIANNKASQNIAFVTHLGDIVQHGSNLSEWKNADAAMDRLDGVVPYSATCGNHDYDAMGSHSAANNYLNNFGPQRYAGYNWYKGSSTNGLNHYQVFSAGGYKFLHLNLEFEPPSEILDWAQSVLSAYANYPTIISTHSYLRDGQGDIRPRYPAWNDGNPGETVYQLLVRTNPQVFMVLNGHFSSDSGENYRVSTNVGGTQVHELCSDYQLHNGSETTGLMRLMRFDIPNNQIQVRTYSPYTNSYETDADSQFNIGINFAQRFRARPIMQTTVFQEGVNAGYGYYRGTVDTTIGPAGMNVAGGSGTNLTVATVGGQSSQTLLKFNTIIGVGSGLIPPNAKIVSAELVFNSNNAGNGAQLYRLKRGWDANSTWDSLGNGMQTNQVEAPSTPTGQIGSLNGGGGALVLKGLKVNVTADIQAWVTGENNNGWLMAPFAGSTNDWGFTSSEASDLSSRPRLMVTWLAENANLSAFQQGTGGYAGVTDTYIASDAPTSSFGTSGTLQNDGPSADVPTSPTKQSLIKFEGFIGNGPNQIPVGATITAAYLRLTTTYSSTTSRGAGFWAYRMLQNWTASVTWNSAFGADGVQADGSETRSSRDLVSGFIDVGSHLFDISGTVQAWINSPGSNFGLAILPPTDEDDGTSYQSSENERISERPQLIVIWSPAASAALPPVVSETPAASPPAPAATTANASTIPATAIFASRPSTDQSSAEATTTSKKRISDRHTSYKASAANKAGKDSTIDKSIMTLLATETGKQLKARRRIIDALFGNEIGLHLGRLKLKSKS